MTAPTSSLLLTLGYGKRSIDAMLDLLEHHGVRFLVDVRSAPWSRYHPDFAHDALRNHLRTRAISYLFLGAELGGRPDDPTCYDETGRVDYDACQKRQAFQQGIERLCTAWKQGQRVALLCSESRPENCHRSKLIGVALAEREIAVLHLDDDDTPLTQDEVMARLTDGQLNLFADLPASATTRSRGQYRPSDT